VEWLSFLLRRSATSVIFALLAAVVSGIASTGLIAIVSMAAGRESSPARALVWAFIGLVVVTALTRLASGVLLSRLIQGAIADLRTHMSSRILAAPLRRLEMIGSHRLLGVLTDDVFIIANTFINIPGLCMNITIVLGCFIYLGWLSLKLLFVVMGFILIGALSYKLMMIPAVRYMKSSREQRDVLFKNIRALLEGTKELKLHRERRKAFISELLVRSASDLKTQSVKFMSIYTAAISWTQTLLLILIGLLLFTPALLTETDLQTRIGCTLAILFLAGPIEAIVNILPTISRANVSLKKVTELGISLKAGPGHNGGAEPEKAAKQSWERIEIAGAVHVYRREGEDGEFSLGPLDLTLRPGELVFVTGGNGSGKTTFAKIVTGLYAPERGEVRLDGVRVDDENREGYRQLFSAVFPDFYVFESFAGLSDEDLGERARDYLGGFKLDKTVRVDGTRFAFSGLSQGQRKRLALLTACLEDRQIYVFDEWAADQDPLFKQIFYLEILPRLKAEGKTVLVISHDDRSYHVADRIIKLDYGKIDYDQPVRSYARPRMAI
jgi:putative ATP-binding cassette transporter